MPFLSSRSRQTLRYAWRRVLHLWVPMAGWTLLVWACVVFVLAPISSAVLGWQVLRGEHLVIGNEELIGWLLGPAGLVYLLLAGTLAVTGGVLRYAGLFYIITDDLEGHRPTVRRAAFRLAPQLPALLKLCLAAVATALVLVAPLLAALGAVYALLLGAHDINYYLTVQPPEWTYALTAAGVLGLVWLVGAAYVAGRLLLTLPEYLDGHRPLRRAARGAWVLAHGRSSRLLRLLAVAAALWVLARFTVDATLLTAVTPLVEWVAGTTDSVRIVALAAGGLLATQLALGAIVGFLGFSFVATVLTRFYYEDTELHASAPPAPSVRALPRSALRTVRHWFRPRRLIPLAVVLFAAGLVGSTLLLERLTETRPVAIHAHRAGPPPAPENTLAALERSIEAGAEYAEIDVQRTRDGVVVVVHDFDLMRVAGDRRRIATTEYGDMAGVVQRPDDGSPPEERRVATLDEFLERARGRIGLNVELKYYGWDPELAPAVVDRIRALDMEDEVVLMSLSVQSVRQLRRLAPDIPVGYVSAVAVGDVVRLPVDFLAVSQGAATRQLIRTAGDRGMEVHVWTVNRADAMTELIERGVDGLITDDPALAVRVRDELAALPTAARLLLRFRAVDVDATWRSREDVAGPD